jgi:hypothetical protein
MNDTQRELEQRALRNVRGLVEKVENQDLADKRSQRRLVLCLAVFVVVATVGVVLYLGERGNNSGKTITIEQKR